MITLDDIKVIMAIDKKCYHESLRYTEEYLKHNSKLLHVLFVNHHGKRSKAAYITYFEDGNGMYIQSIAVRPKCRGCGLGKALLQTVVMYANVSKKFKVDMHVMSETMYNIAEREGFVPIRRYKEFFGIYPATLMRLRLKNG